MLHYLGISDRIDYLETDTKKADFLKFILGKHQQNIRTELPKVRSLLYPMDKNSRK